MARQPRKKEPRILRIFISYASEDLKIAHAIASTLAGALPEGFSEICFDKWTLQAGDDFKSQLEARLEKTDILIVVSTGIQKDAFAFPAWEVGFFQGVNKGERQRRLVPMYLDHPPAAAAEFQGFDLKIPPALLPKTVEEFNSSNDIREDDRLCEFIRDLQAEVDQIKKDAGFATATPHERQDPVTCVKNMRLAVFSHMKTKIEAVVKPQKQIMIQSTSAAIRDCKDNLPLDARIIPAGGSSMSIFGLEEKEMSWAEFQKSTAGPHQDSFREAITSVVTSSHAGINVDNSQIILSNDESKTYRVVLTSATRYWDDRLELSLYFVETLPRTDYGNKDTTMMLKGLQLVCRYRFLFLESTSIFSAGNLLNARDEDFPEKAASLLKELNLMRQEASSAGLHEAAYWRHFVDWDSIRAMTDAFRPREQEIRELTGLILNAKNRKEDLAKLRVELSNVVAQLEDATRGQNASLIEAMANTLLSLVKVQSAGAAGC